MSEVPIVPVVPAEPAVPAVPAVHAVPVNGDFRMQVIGVDDTPLKDPCAVSLCCLCTQFFTCRGCLDIPLEISDESRSREKGQPRYIGQHIHVWSRSRQMWCEDARVHLVHDDGGIDVLYDGGCSKTIPSDCIVDEVRAPTTI